MLLLYIKKIIVTLLMTIALKNILKYILRPFLNEENLTAKYLIVCEEVLEGGVATCY